LAIVWAMRHFQSYIYNREVLVITDHKPLTDLKRLKEPNARLGSLFVKLMQYKHDIIYRPGVQNRTADLLSRLPVQCKLISIESEIDWVQKQELDEDVKLVKTL
jgi:hypothetical protein